jgi:hypothetical protein
MSGRFANAIGMRRCATVLTDDPASAARYFKMAADAGDAIAM